MAQNKDNTSMEDLLWQCMGMEDPMLAMLDWLCSKLMEIEVSAQIGAQKHTQNKDRQSSRSGYRPRRLDTRAGTLYLLVPKVRKGGYIPFFVTERKRSEAALIQVVQEAYINGVSTRKIEKLAQALGIENMSRSQVSALNKGLNEQAEAFRNRPLEDMYPVLWVDAMYEKVRYGGRVISMAIQVVCGVNQEGRREVLAIEPMLEESLETYNALFEKLKDRGLNGPSLVISDAHKGLVRAIAESFPGCTWQRCKVHFMRNILAHVPKKDKQHFADQLKLIWMASKAKEARHLAKELSNTYGTQYPKAIEVLEDGLEDSLAYFSFPELDKRKVSSTNLMERLNREIRRRTKTIGIFPSPESYTRLLSMYLIEYTEDWSCGKAYLSKASLETLS
jgi:putative transposase